MIPYEVEIYLNFLSEQKDKELKEHEKKMRGMK